MIGECFNSYFIKITDTLDLPEETICAHEDITHKNPVLQAISKYKHHPSIEMIKQKLATLRGRINLNFPISPRFRFGMKSIKEDQRWNTDQLIKKGLRSLLSGNHPSYEQINWKLWISRKIKEGRCLAYKKNYRPIIVLSALSKVFERQISQQMTPFAKTKISRLLCGFREGHSAQHVLFRLIEKCRKCLDDGGVVGMVLMELSKAFDCLPYDLLIAKLEAYGFGMKCLRFIHSYLSGRKQRMKIGSTSTDWLDIVSGVLQGSVLDPCYSTFTSMIWFILTKIQKFVALQTTIPFTLVALTWIELLLT